jgi:aminomethyltransferase
VLSLDGEPVGRVTSGSPAPFLKTNVAMALVDAAATAAGGDLLVDVRGKRVRARQAPLPFYKRAKT